MAEDKKPKSLLKRKIELDAISEWVEDNQKVLDLGCGRGVLLEELTRKRKIYGVGVDSDFDKITLAIKRSINAYHGDIMDMLSCFDDNSFDWIICSRTLPELDNPKDVIFEALRVANRVAVGFVNYAYWQNRVAMLFKGERLVNEVFPTKWDDSRPMNLISVNSFKLFCKANDIKIEKEHFLRADWQTPCKIAPNIMSGYAIFEISKK